MWRTSEGPSTFKFTWKGLKVEKRHYSTHWVTDLVFFFDHWHSLSVLDIALLACNNATAMWWQRHCPRGQVHVARFTSPASPRSTWDKQGRQVLVAFMTQWWTEHVRLRRPTFLEPPVDCTHNWWLDQEIFISYLNRIASILHASLHFCENLTRTGKKRKRFQTIRFQRISPCLSCLSSW